MEVLKSPPHLCVAPSKPPLALPLNISINALIIYLAHQTRPSAPSSTRSCWVPSSTRRCRSSVKWTPRRRPTHSTGHSTRRASRLSCRHACTPARWDSKIALNCSGSVRAAIAESSTQILTYSPIVYPIHCRRACHALITRPPRTWTMAQFPAGAKTQLGCKRVPVCFKLWQQVRPSIASNISPNFLHSLYATPQPRTPVLSDSQVDHFHCKTARWAISRQTRCKLTASRDSMAGYPRALCWNWSSWTPYAWPETLRCR